jgi:hypothetical protein
MKKGMSIIEAEAAYIHKKDPRSGWAWTEKTEIKGPITRGGRRAKKLSNTTRTTRGICYYPPQAEEYMLIIPSLERFSEKGAGSRALVNISASWFCVETP